MLVTLEDSIFAPGNRPLGLELQQLFQLGFDGRHHLQIDPVYDPGADSELVGWIQSLDEATRDVVTLVLEVGLHAASSYSANSAEIRVGVLASSNWSGGVPTLTVSDALALMHRPLRLLVENLLNDGAFLLCLLQVAEERFFRRFEEARQQGWLEFEHGGGINQMPSIINTKSQSERFRSWVLFDSDAREPGVPSFPSQTLGQCCDTHAVPYHRLERRMQENYLPLGALVGWMTRCSNRPIRRRRQQLLNAFSDMNLPQQHHYNMKGGFFQDLPNVPSLYPTNVRQNRHLKSGFGGNIGELFRSTNHPIDPASLVKNGQKDEIERIANSILRRM